MSVSKHGKFYRVSYRAPGHPSVIHESYQTAEEAHLRDTQIKLQKMQGCFVPPAAMIDPISDPELYRKTVTLSKLMERYLTDYGEKVWAPNTLDSACRMVNNYILPFLGEVPLCQLTTLRLEQYYDDLLKQPAVVQAGHQPRLVTHSTVKEVHKHLRCALNQGIRWGLLEGTNPTEAVLLSKSAPHQRTFWSAEEASLACSQVQDPVLRLCLLFALLCSMRIGEILGLTWDCVHIDDNIATQVAPCLRVKKELQRTSKAAVDSLRAAGRDPIFYAFPEQKVTSPNTTVLVLKTPKTQSSIRTIYLSSVMISELKRTKAEQEALKAADPDYCDFGLVVAQETGRPFEAGTISDKLHTFAKEVGLPSVVFHSLRHTSTSVKLKLSGGDIKAVQGDTGHSQSNMVTDLYSHSFDEDRRALSGRIDAAFFPDAQPAPAAGPIHAPTSSDPNIAKLMEALADQPDKVQSLMMLLGIQ